MKNELSNNKDGKDNRFDLMGNFNFKVIMPKKNNFNFIYERRKKQNRLQVDIKSVFKEFFGD